MKTLATLALVAGFAMRLYAEPVLTDIVTYEALVLDEASGQTVGTGGPWMWEDLSFQTMGGVSSGPARTIVVKCRNAAGQTIFGGAINAANLMPPFSPFDPPNPLGEVTLSFYSENYTLTVLLNGIYYVGEMIMLPAQDDPVVPPVLTVSVDIKPGSATNPFNVRAEGLLPVAILGTAEVNVGQIDRASLKLAGISPVRYSVSDLQNDGYPDLVLHFRDQDVAGVLAGVADGEVVGLELTGVLLNGTAIKGTDSITVQAKKDKKDKKEKKDKKDEDQHGKKDAREDHKSKDDHRRSCS
jgi:hypothetical protein